MATATSEAGRGPVGRFFAGPSVGTILDANRGMGPGFDLCRVGLSVVIVLIHAVRVTDPHSSLFTGPIRPIYLAILPLFFGLSGFLVTGSALRLRDLRTFLAFRVLRIMPALMVEVTLSAVILGSLLTVLPVTEYFTNRRFFAYFGNIVGWIHFRLPGVFLTNPHPEIVNANLWTLHPEFISYGMMALLMMTKLVYSRRAMTLIWLAATIAGIIASVFFDKSGLRVHYSGDVLIYCFLTGTTAFHWRHRLPVNGWLALLCAVVSYALVWVPHTSVIVQAPLIYTIIWLGMQRFPRIELLQRGDYSYGIYLYGYPIEQTLVFLFPAIAVWWLIFPLTAVLVFGIAALSWHYIEKPALRLKKFVLAKGSRPLPASTTEPA